jgi:hypothetical protein
VSLARNRQSANFRHHRRRRRRGRGSWRRSKNLFVHNLAREQRAFSPCGVCIMSRFLPHFPSFPLASSALSALHGSYCTTFQCPSSDDRIVEHLRLEAESAQATPLSLDSLHGSRRCHWPDDWCALSSGTCARTEAREEKSVLARFLPGQVSLDRLSLKTIKEQVLSQGISFQRRPFPW